MIQCCQRLCMRIGLSSHLQQCPRPFIAVEPDQNEGSRVEMHLEELLLKKEETAVRELHLATTQILQSSQDVEHAPMAIELNESAKGFAEKPYIEIEMNQGEDSQVDADVEAHCQVIAATAEVLTSDDIAGEELLNTG